MTPNLSIPNTDAVSVMQFGAKGDGSANDTQAFLEADGYQASKGGGRVYVPCLPFLIDPYVQGAGVELCGTISGPFDPYRPPLSPSTTSAPTLLVNSHGSPFLTQGIDGKFRDLQVYDPNQNGPTASAPIVAPAMLKTTSTGNISGLTLINPFKGIDIGCGRISIDNCKISAFSADIVIEDVSDVVLLSRIQCGVGFLTVNGGMGPSENNLAMWSLMNGVAYDVGRADGLLVSDLTCFWRQIGLRCRDTTNPPLPGDAGLGNPTSGYIKGSRLDFDTVQYAGVFSSTNNLGGGVKIDVWDMGSCNTIGKAIGQTAIYLESGGNSAPEVIISVGSQRGSWAYGPTVVRAGNLITRDVRGIDC